MILENGIRHEEAIDLLAGGGGLLLGGFAGDGGCEPATANTTSACPSISLMMTSSAAPLTTAWGVQVDGVDLKDDDDDDDNKDEFDPEGRQRCAPVVTVDGTSAAAIGSSRPKRTLEPVSGDPIKVTGNGEKRTTAPLFFF
ncbi:unnamed protein product [Urochloa humidicola]